MAWVSGLGRSQRISNSLKRKNKSSENSESPIFIQGKALSLVSHNTVNQGFKQYGVCFSLHLQMNEY